MFALIKRTWSDPLARVGKTDTALADTALAAQDRVRKGERIRFSDRGLPKS